MSAPEKRIDLIERSLRCFFVGWCSLVPLAGPFLFPIAIRLFLHVRRNGENDWNPARKYLTGGLVLATLGCIETLALVGLVVVTIVSQNSPPFSDQ